MQFITKTASFAAALVMSATVAGAQTTVTGTTTGCFGAGCTNFAAASNFAIDATGTAVAFAGTTFSGTTNPVTNAFTVGNFGSLTLTGLSGSTPNATFTTPFTLLFTLSAPAGSSAPTSTFTVSGFVGNVGGAGARDIQYTAGTPATFTFTGGTGTIAIDGGQIGPMATTISGRVTASAVPEPSTYAMMGIGLSGLLVAARRRRSA